MAKNIAQNLKKTKYRAASVPQISLRSSSFMFLRINSQSKTEGLILRETVYSVNESD